MTLNKRPRIRASNPISRFFRPMFEKKAIKSVLGGIISVTSLASGLVFMPVDQTVAAANIGVSSASLSMETQKSFADVLPAYTGISQGFHLGHPGIDITAPLGSKIYPVRAGKVIKVQFLTWDYGHAVWIDNGNNTISLYAHMGKVFVNEGDALTTKDVIGEVGVTGHTTGPHLHLEVHIDGESTDPQPYLALGAVNKR